MPKQRQHQTPDKMRIYAIGDIHGYLDALHGINRLIWDDMKSAPQGTECKIIYLGDYTDRGPDSKGVIEYLIKQESEAANGTSFDHLRGNHDEALLKIMARQIFKKGVPLLSELPKWIDPKKYGGLATLQSYGFDGKIPLRKQRKLDLVSEWLKANLPPEHVTFLNKLKYHQIYGDYLFVHAGVDLNKPLNSPADLEKQDVHDLIWIRDPFLKAAAPAIKYRIVHGHTIESSNPIMHHQHRIGVDTGCGQGGPLSCIVLEGTTVRTLTFKRPGPPIYIDYNF